MRVRVHWGWALLALAALAPLRASVTPNPLFSDNAILQQGMPVPVWGTATPGETVTVSLAGQTAKAVADAAGDWRVELAPLAAGGPHELTIACGDETKTAANVLVGEVWIASGQSNMAWTLRNTVDAEAAIAASGDPQLRLLTVPRGTEDKPQQTAEVAWVESTPETTPNFSAVGYWFGNTLRHELGVPVGIINTSYGGTPAEAWTRWRTLLHNPELKPILDRYNETLRNYLPTYRKYQEQMAKWREEAAAAKAAGQPAPRMPSVPYGPRSPHKPAGLYNAMIAPLVPYAMRGAIWYQGESNAGRAWQYRELFPTMIEDWRDAWGQGDFPFYFVQLAPYMKIVDQPGDSAWAELREAQLYTQQTVPNTAQAVIIDVGEEDDIHPRRKMEVGQRLARLALAYTYDEPVVPLGPVYRSMRVEGGAVRLFFDEVADGLVAGQLGDEPELKGFAVAGPDRAFRNAQARIEGDTVVVWSDEVPNPVAVRYGWANYPVVNLWNANGVPATPFRTDDWPATTQPKDAPTAAAAEDAPWWQWTGSSTERLPY